MRITTFCGILVASAGLLGSVALAAPASAAASKIHIVKVKFDSDGSDTPVTNAKLNDEYVVIKNTDTRTRTITGWTLTDASNHTYTFPTTTIKAGVSIKVRTGSGTDKLKTKFQNRGYYIWNNTSDTAKLRNTSGTGGDTCSWKTSDPGNSKNC
jgi:hypothetical protein